MKKRFGFVSNSSSSSFVCSICKEIESAMDASLSDFDMIRCINGHEMHRSCSKISEEVSDMLSDIYDFGEYLEDYKEDLGPKYDEWKKMWEDREKLPYAEQENLDLGNGVIIDKYDGISLAESHCPICNFSVFKDETVLKFIFKSGLLKEESVKNEIKSRFKTYEELNKWVNEK